MCGLDKSWRLTLSQHSSDLQSSTSEAAEDISAFMVIFFEHFSKFKGLPFHMAGESYGVRIQYH